MTFNSQTVAFSLTIESMGHRIEHNAFPMANNVRNAEKLHRHLKVNQTQTGFP